MARRRIGLSSCCPVDLVERAHRASRDQSYFSQRHAGQPASGLHTADACRVVCRDKCAARPIGTVPVVGGVPLRMEVAGQCCSQSDRLGPAIALIYASAICCLGGRQAGYLQNGKPRAIIGYFVEDRSDADYSWPRKQRLCRRRIRCSREPAR